VSNRNFKASVALSLALFLFSPLTRSGAFAGITEQCLRLFDNVSNVKTNIRATLSSTDDWESTLNELRDGVTSHSRQPFAIRIQDVDHQDRLVTPTAGHFEHADIQVGREPKHAIPEGGMLIRNPSFGYDGREEFRRIGSLEYIVVDANDQIVEMGGGTQAVIDEFFRHLHGVELTPNQLGRISELNGKLLAALRGNTASRKKLLEFATSRKWPVGLAEEGQLAYFDPELFDIRAWAGRNGFTIDELVDAGWYHLDFDRYGKGRYVVNAPKSIKIPFPPAEGETGIPLWRTRTLAKDRPNAPKYLSWQVDRSIDRNFKVAERLYNGGNLNKIKGKTIVITEGEFKCLVTQKLTGIPMFGIPGITQFDDEMIQALVDAQAGEYVVILDRDPEGKAMFRADQVTDSNRAAFQFAKDLERLGAKNVRVGMLPDPAFGEKLGIDDLGLKYGVDAVKKVIAEAKTPDEYAKAIGLNTEFQELMRRRSRLRSAIGQRDVSNARRGTQHDPLIARAYKRLKQITRTTDSYFENELNGARSLTNASGKVNSIRPVVSVPNAEMKKVLLTGGRHVDPNAFQNDVLLLDYVTADAKITDCRPVLCGGQVPFSAADLRAASAGESPSGTLLAARQAMTDISDETGFRAATFEEFSDLVLSGQLTHVFPLDEYSFEFGVQLQGANGTAAVLPIVVFKRNSGKAVAIANLHVPSSPTYWSQISKRFDATLDFLRGRH
jgi:hypothetical protein